MSRAACYVTEYALRTGVPRPKDPRGGKRAAWKCPYPFLDMEIGASFEIPIPSHRSAKIMRLNVTRWARRFAEREHPGFCIRTYILRNGAAVGVWRTA